MNRLERLEELERAYQGALDSKMLFYGQWLEYAQALENAAPDLLRLVRAAFEHAEYRGECVGCPNVIIEGISPHAAECPLAALLKEE